jgi:hypothetical protein
VYSNDRILTGTRCAGHESETVKGGGERGLSESYEPPHRDPCAVVAIHRHFVCYGRQHGVTFDSIDHHASASRNGNRNRKHSGPTDFSERQNKIFLSSVDSVARRGGLSFTFDSHFVCPVRVSNKKSRFDEIVISYAPFRE